MKNYYLTSAKKLKSGIDEYFALCDSINDPNAKTQTKPYTLAGLCLHLDCTRRQFYDLVKNKSTEHIAEMAQLRIEASTEENVLNGKLASNPASNSLKYNFGWSEKAIRTDSGEMIVRLEPNLEGWGE